MAAQILGMDIKGITVRRVLVAPAADIASEFYLAAVLDRTAKRDPADGLRRGRRGDRGRSPRRTPRPSAPARAPPPRPAGPPGARAWPSRSAWVTSWRRRSAIAKGVFRAMIDNDADLVEINPLAIVRTGPDGA